MLACCASAPAGMLTAVPSPTSTLPPCAPTLCVMLTFLASPLPATHTAMTSEARMGPLLALRVPKRFLADQPGLTQVSHAEVTVSWLHTEMRGVTPVDWPSAVQVHVMLVVPSQLTT